MGESNGLNETTKKFKVDTKVDKYIPMFRVMV